MPRSARPTTGISALSGPTNAGDTHTRYKRRARAYEWTLEWKIHRHCRCSRVYSAILMRRTVVVICWDWRGRWWRSKKKTGIRLHEIEFNPVKSRHNKQLLLFRRNCAWRATRVETAFAESRLNTCYIPLPFNLVALKRVWNSAL